MIDVRREDLIVMMEAGYIYLAMRKFSEAKAVFEGVAALAPKNAIPLVAAGNVHFSQAQYGRAIVFYKRALEVEPTSAYAKAYMGESLLFDGRKDRAILHLEAAIALDKDNAVLPFAKALLDLIHKGFDPYQLKKEQTKAMSSATPTATHASQEMFVAAQALPSDGREHIREAVL